jgi:menaquinone-dependent protoporphyrinogen oxidase
MHVLVTAASRHDATREIAAAIADGLARRGIEAEARAVEEVRGGDLRGYDAVVLGSAVYMGRWLKPARAFAREHAAELTARPLWLFSSGPLGPPDHPVPPEGPADAAELLELTGAREHRLLAGRLERARLGLGERTMARAVHAPEGDARDWEAIDAYAGEIAAALG